MRRLRSERGQSVTLAQSRYFEQRYCAFAGIALGLKNALFCFALLDTVVGDTSSFRAISRKDAPSLNTSSISHLSSKLMCALFFLGVESFFPGPGEGIADSGKTAGRRKALHA